MKRFSLFIVIVLALSSCLKQETYPDQPVLSNVVLSISPDSASLNMSFTDGDGNFGLEQSDTTGDFGLCEHRYNIYCFFYYKFNGQWKLVNLDDCANTDAVPYHLRAPWVKPTGQNPTQKGDIKVALSNYFPENDVNTGYSVDTCKFDIYLVDRDFNQSNTLSTAEYLVQH